MGYKETQFSPESEQRGENPNSQHTEPSEAHCICFVLFFISENVCSVISTRSQILKPGCT